MTSDFVHTSELFKMYKNYKEWRWMMSELYQLDLPPHGKLPKTRNQSDGEGLPLSTLSYTSNLTTPLSSPSSSSCTSSTCSYSDPTETDSVNPVSNTHIPVSDEDVTLPHQKPDNSTPHADNNCNPVVDKPRSATRYTTTATIPNIYHKSTTANTTQSVASIQNKSSMDPKVPKTVIKLNQSNAKSNNNHNTNNNSCDKCGSNPNGWRKITQEEYNKMDANQKGHYARNQLDDIGQAYLDKLHNACVTLHNENQKLKKEKLEILESFYRIYSSMNDTISKYNNPSTQLPTTNAQNNS